MDYRALLIKYVSHVAAAEGVSFATSIDLAPCKMLSREFTAEEKWALENDIFVDVRRWDESPE
jgi:hypothetical protein